MYPIYTYKSKEEYKHLDEQRCIEVCSLNKLINNHDFKICDYIDITSFILHLRNNPHNIILLNNIEEYLNYGCEVIIHENYVDDALDIYYTLFDKKIELSEIENFPEDIYKTKQFNKLTLYYYENNELNDFIKYCDTNEYEYYDIGLSFLLEMIKNEYITGKHVIDITSYLNNDNIITINYFFKLLNNEEITFICDKNKYNDNLTLYFKELKHISEKYADFNEKHENKDNSTITITKLNKNNFKLLKNTLNDNLIGHEYFKEDLYKNLYNFRIMNSINLKKIFSIFILGNSGLGKTEVARIINKFLNKNTELIKINFGNYTSKDSLNSLIGSPRGYIGSEDGELSIKLNKNHTGVILCDEFEKADSKIVSFFLELLEEGKFTDSQSNEYDLNGYIIIFTSNLDENGFINQIPDEFKSRIDLISKFNNLTLNEKDKFVKNEINELKNKIKGNNEKFNLNLENFEFNYDLNQTNNLRDIKRELYNQIIEEIDDNE